MPVAKLAGQVVPCRWQTTAKGQSPADKYLDYISGAADWAGRVAVGPPAIPNLDAEKVEYILWQP